MIDHSSFIIENKKPNKDDFYHLYISDPEKDKKYNSINLIVKAMKKGIFISGVFFPHSLMKELKKGTFSRINFSIKNENYYFTYQKNGKNQTVKSTSKNFKLNHFISILKDAGYSVRLDFKTKIFEKKNNLYLYNIFSIKEKLMSELFKECKIENKEVALKIFNHCWVEGNTIKTHTNFLKQITLLKKIGHKI